MLNQYRADATNSAVWQKCKLHTTEVETCYTGTAVLEDLSFEVVLKHLESQRLLGDLQIVRESNSAGTLGCLRKQMVPINT